MTRGEHKARFRTVEPAPDSPEEPRELPPAAKRALAEADERRRKMDARPRLPKEFEGRKGPEPTRYGDWEKDGIVSDF